MSPHPEIARAIRLAGSQARLAELSGLSQQQLSKLLRRQRRVTAETALAIERATSEAVRRWQLRPDLWDKPMPAERTGAAA